MHSKVSILQGLFRPILRLLGMSSPPPSDVEFPGDTCVEDWEACLRERYCSRDPEKSPKDRSRMKTLKVITIRRYKERKHAEHEYLIAEVSDPNLNRSHYLRIERAAEDPPTKDNISPLSSQLSLSSQSSLGALKKVPAHDHVTKMASWPTTGDICIGSLACRDSQMILLDLAIVAKVVHDHSDKYQLFKRQCFWYSDVITGVLEQHFPQVHKVVYHSSLEAAHARDAEMDSFDKLSGTYMKVPIYFRRMSVIKEIHDIFVPYKLDFQSSVKVF